MTMYTDNQLSDLLFDGDDFTNSQAENKGYLQCAECEDWAENHIVYFRGDDELPYCEDCHKRLAESDMVVSDDFPSWALCYLINGDDSGLTDDEIAMVDSWVDNSGCNVFSISYFSENDKHFSWSPEFGLACDCVVLLGVKID